jgi:hypothetical protein
MVQLEATRYSCIAILWVSLVSFAAITLCVASQRVLTVVYFVMTQSGKFWIYPRILEVAITITAYNFELTVDIIKLRLAKGPTSFRINRSWYGGILLCIKRGYTKPRLVNDRLKTHIHTYAEPSISVTCTCINEAFCVIKMYWITKFQQQ